MDQSQLNSKCAFLLNEFSKKVDEAFTESGYSAVINDPISFTLTIKKEVLQKSGQSISEKTAAENFAILISKCRKNAQGQWECPKPKPKP